MRKVSLNVTAQSNETKLEAVSTFRGACKDVSYAQKQASQKTADSWSSS